MKEIQSHLQAAIGYLELGMVEDAANEIECLPQEHKNSSPVLGVRLEIYRTANQWSLMEVVAIPPCPLCALTRWPSRQVS